MLDSSNNTKKAKSRLLLLLVLSWLCIIHHTLKLYMLYIFLEVDWEQSGAIKKKERECRNDLLFNYRYIDIEFLAALPAAGSGRSRQRGHYGGISSRPCGSGHVYCVVGVHARSNAGVDTTKQDCYFGIQCRYLCKAIMAVISYI